MTIVRLLLLVLGLSHLRGCATPLCDAAGGFETKVFNTRTGDQMVADAAKPAGGPLIVETAMSYLPPEYHHTVVKMDDAYGPEELATFNLSNHFGSGVVASGDSWWYSLAGRRAGVPPAPRRPSRPALSVERDARRMAGETPALQDERGVFFLTPEQTFVPVGEIHSADWFPFEGPEPRGLLIGPAGDRVRALEVTPGGVRREWSLPFDGVKASGWRDVERLADGTIALVTFRRDSGLRLELLAGEEAPAAVPLRPGSAAVRLATALSADGLLAVVTESRLGELEAAVLDPKNPGTPRWLALTTKDEPGRFPHVVFHENRFIAAWFAEEASELRARTFTAERAGAAATIAPFLRRGSAPVSISILPEGEELLFVWQEDEPAVRRVPVEFAGLWFAERLCKWLFSGTSVAL